MRLTTGAKYGLALFAFFLIALFLRLYFPYHNVFGSGWVNFQETDAWYNMRQTLILALHFPHRMLFDPYYLYPGGGTIGSPPFFYLLVGFFAWMFGAGSPTQKVIETVGAYLPAILGALVTVPVYFIGKELFNRKAGLLAAALIAILPGQFLWRSMLGFTDYHVTETLFSATAMMFLILALKSSRDKDLSFRSILHRDWGALRRPLLYATLAGISLGLYLLTWAGAGLFIFIIFAFAIIQYVIDHLRGRSTDYIGIVGAVSFFIALVMMSFSWNGYANWNLGFAALIIGILVFLILGAISSFMVGRNIRKLWYPIVLVCLGGIGAALFYVADPSLFRSILNQLHVFTPTAGMLTVAEVQPLSLSLIWENFTICFYLALISLAIMAYFVVREGSAGKTLLFVWSLVILVATFSQNRFAYYFAVNVAVLTAYLSWRALEFAGLREVPEGIEVAEDFRNRRGKEAAKTTRDKKSKRKKGKARRQEQRLLARRYLSARYIYVSLTLVVVFFLVFYPNIGIAIDRVSASTGVDVDWHESLVWMGNNTPDPFNNPDFFYELYQKPPPGEPYPYPVSAYGVMSWWDYGYYITYIAHRIPNASPNGQAGAANAGLFFTAQDEASGSQILDKLGSKYVIIDAAMSYVSLTFSGKFYAMATWAGKSQSQFYDVFYQGNTQTGFQAVMLYYPEYYQAMSTRLYLFGGQQWVPQQVTVISWTETQLTSTDGSTFTAKVISDMQSFSSYDSAKAFVDTHPNYKIVGSDPLVSPVPLDKLEHYKLIHQSPTIVATQQTGNISEVEIFQYEP